MALGKRDSSAVLEAAVALTANPVPDFVGVLEVLRTLIPCASASFNDMALATRDFRYAIVPEGDVAVAARLKPAYDMYVHQHPLINAVARQPSLGAVRFCDVEGGEMVTGTDLFRKFYAPFDVRYQLAIRLPSPPDVVVAYALNRSADAGEFSDRDVAILNVLSGPLAMHHRVSLENDRTGVLTIEMDRNAWAVASVRSDGVVEASSSPVLTVGDTAPTALVELIESHGVPPSDPSRHEVVLGADRWQCVVHPVPLGPTVLFLSRISESAVDLERLQAAGLTPRQSAVLWELARTGGSNGDLARQLGMSEGTVKKHLETVFRALKVTSRAAAILKARELAE